ncbi:Pectate lyase, partial [Rhizoctonia solani]
MFVLGSLAAVLFASKGALAVGSAFGFATGTTGGAAAAPATPTSTTQLASWLSDGTARTIVLDRTYDFTDTQGSTTATGCKPWTCSPNPQLAINANNWCSSTAAQVSVTYKNAGTSGLPVGSNKTILGKGTSGWIKGKGLKLAGSKNVIIQNIRISDINHQYVWGGDAIDLQGATNVWIDHNYFNRVGRQFIVTFQHSTSIRAPKSPSPITTLMDGPTTRKLMILDKALGFYSPSPTNLLVLDVTHHYWAFLMLGKGDQITFARNHVYYTAGRGPHIGGTSGNSPATKFSYSYFNDITGHALDADVGATVLAEGNYFNNVKTPSTGNANGSVFAPTSSTMADQCSSALGRKCVLNTLSGSGTLPNAAKNGIISQFTASVIKSASLMDQSSVPSYVLANAGTGKVN